MTLKEFITKGDRFAAKVGVEIVSVTEKSATTQLLVTKEHLNAGGVCPGGAIFTVADVALAARSGLSGCNVMTWFQIK